MFFRIKKIKGKDYAYIVENEWKATAKSVELNASSSCKRACSSYSQAGRSREHLTLRGMKLKGSRQKVKGYIGRVYRFELKNNIGFQDHNKIQNLQNYIENNDKNRIINDLIEWELFKFGISKEEFIIDLNDIRVQKNKKNIALLINDGFMCSAALKNLLEFKPQSDETDGYLFAKAFVEAGIKVPQEIFVGLFGKLYKEK